MEALSRAYCSVTQPVCTSTSSRGEHRMNETDAMIARVPQRFIQCSGKMHPVSDENCNPKAVVSETPVLINDLHLTEKTLASQTLLQRPRRVRSQSTRNYTYRVSSTDVNKARTSPDGGSQNHTVSPRPKNHTATPLRRSHEEVKRYDNHTHEDIPSTEYRAEDNEDDGVLL